MLLQCLEDRVLFSASALGDLHLEPTTNGSATESVNATTTANALTGLEVAFIDRAVDGYEKIAADLRSQHDDSFRIVLLDADRDGVEQIGDVLHGLVDIQAVHIFSHGESGALRLGNARLTSGSMLGIHSDAMQAIKSSLSTDGDLLLYGCNFAEGEIGRAAANRLAQLTGADLAASTNLTGHATLDADWKFETLLGNVETEVAVSTEFQASAFISLGPVAQEFFVPMTEQGIYDANEKILDEGTFGAVDTDTITIVGITVNQDATSIVYDHHEDGYEADLDAPLQATTEIWGDGNLSNGVAPGFATDLFSAGDIVLLQNTVDTTAVPDTTFDFDGGDRFGADRGVAVTRAGWSDFPGTVLAGTVEVADTSRWGTDYISPVGEDTAIGSVYEYVGLFVQAEEDNTAVDIDIDGDGTDDLNLLLQQGEIRHVDGGIQQGATVTADKNVQVDLLTGDRDSGVDSRWYMLRPRSTWSSSYLNPATTTSASAPGSITIYNPHTTNLTVDIETNAGTNSVSVTAGGTHVEPLALTPTDSGQLVTSQDGRDFYVAFAMDTDAAHTTYDWGFSLLPTDAITEMAFAGWAPGSLDLTGNGSPIWVTANSATTLYVDYDGDPATGALTDPFGNQYDGQIPLARLESVQLYDIVNLDNDQSGLRVYTVDGTDISAAWGIDPSTAGTGSPFLDMGTVVLPTAVPDIEKNVAVTNDVNGNGVADPGDTVTWTITITNQDINPMISVVAFDELPPHTSYVANSTTVAGLPYADDLAGSTLLPLDEGGGPLPDVAPKATLVVTFETLLDDFPVIYDEVPNTVFVQSDQFTTGDTETLPINTTPLKLEKSIGSIDHASSGISGNIDVTYNFTIENYAVIDIQDLTLVDDWAAQLGGNFVGVVAGSVSVSNLSATTPPVANTTYSGGATESMISGGLLESTQRFAVSVTIEVDPDADPASHVNDNLVNQATVSGEDPLDPGVRLSDLSDDPTDLTDTDTEGDLEPDDPTAFTYSSLELDKSSGAVTPAASGTNGHFDVAYTFTVTNTGIESLSNFRVVDDWASQFGTNFVGIVSGSIAVNNVNATTTPTANLGYSGGATENMLNATGLLRSGESFQISLAVEVDPDSDPSQLLNGLLVNQATLTADDSSGPLIDFSDDPADATNRELDGDNDPDDPTTVSVPAIALTKTINGLTTAASGTAGNVDVTYEFVVTNTGGPALDTLSIVDDWGTEFGDAFVAINVGSVSVTNIDATTVPLANATYSGGPAENMFSSSGLLQSGQSFRVSVVVEVDPDHPTANLQPDGSLENQATVSARDPSNALVTDLSDDSADPTNTDADGDNDPDDPTSLQFADLVTVKTLVSGDATPAEGDIVTFQIEVTNNGGTQATNVALTDLLPANLAATSNNGVTTQGFYNSSTGLWAVGSLNNGTSATLTLEGTVRVGQGGNTITNTTTTAAGDQEDLSTVGDDLTEQVVVNNDANLVTVKTLTSGDPTPDEGDTVTFQIEVTNNGAAQATNVSLTDLLPAGITATAGNGVVSQGLYSAATGLWSVGTLDRTASATLTLEGTVDVGQGGNTITNNTTAATGDQNDPTTVGDDLIEQVIVNNDANLVTVKTLASGNPTPDEGDTVTFQIEVTNNGVAQATNISLTDVLPAGITGTAGNGVVSQGLYSAATGLWSVGTLDRTASATLTLEGTVDVGQGGNTITNNTTAATGDQNDPTTAGDDLTEQVVVDNDANLVTVKTLASGDATPQEGETVTFQIEVTNNGAAQATNVSLTDLLPAGLVATANNGAVSQGVYNSVSGVWTLGSLDTGNSATLTLEGNVAAGESGNTITNTTTAATGDQNDPTTAGDDYVETVTVVNEASLVTVKTLASGDATPDEGDTVTFQIEVTNNGSAQATNVTLFDRLPAGLTATSNNGTASQGSYNPTTRAWSIGTLDNGSTATLTIEGTVNVGEGGNTITNTTSPATGDQDDPDSIGDIYQQSVVVNDDANLVTVKTLASGDATPDEGDTVAFQIEVTNNGAAQATNVSLTDLLPAGITATVVNGTVSQGSYNNGSGAWTIGTLDTGATATLLLEGIVDAGQGGNTITNTTSAATGDQNDPTTIGDDYDEGVTINNDANLVTVKTLTSGDATPDEGDTVAFQIEVTNSGAAQATSVSLTDLLPTGLTATTANGVASQGSYNATTGTWLIGTLNNGNSATLNLVGTVDVGQAGSTITNTTTPAMGDQDDPTTLGDDYEEQVTVNNDASLVTVKTLLSGDATPDEGDTVTFQIEVSNNGAAQATNVSLSDLLPNGISASASNGTVSQGSYNATSGLWTIGTLNTGTAATLLLEGTVDAGQGGNTITNTTTAASGDQNDPDTIGDDLEETVVVSNDANLVTVKTLQSGDATPSEGDSVTFQIQVTNNGANQATSVSLTDLLPNGITATAANGTTSQGVYSSATGIWSIGTINNGAVATLTLEGTVDAGQGGNTITNLTTAAVGDQNDPTTIGDDLVEQVVVSNDADLVTVKTLLSGDATPDEGDVVTFQIEVTNRGAALATNTSLTDFLPAGLSATAGNGTPSQGSYAPGTGLWTIGTLATIDTATLVLEGTVELGQGGNTITNVTTTATSDQNDPTTLGDDLDESVVVGNDANLITVKTLGTGASGPFEEGDTVSFQIEVTNAGPTQATNVSLTDLLPIGFTPTTNNGTISHGSYDAGTGVWNIGTLNNVESATLLLEGIIDVGQAGVTITNVTTPAVGDQNDPTTAGDDYEEEITVLFLADLVTVKTLQSGNPSPEEGETVTFNIEVTNDGAAQATNVSLTDLLPTGLTATSNNGAVSQGSYLAATGLWNIGTLSSGQIATLTLEGVVDAGQGGNTITNITTAAAGDQDDPTSSGDDYEESITPTRTRIELEKSTFDVAPASSGNAYNFDVTYEFTVTNSGSVDLNNLALTDDWTTHFGSNFVRIVPGSVSVSDINATALPAANGAYGGGPTENMLDGSGLLAAGEQFVVRVVAEVDPDSDPSLVVNNALVNQGVVSAFDALDPGNSVSDPSDDPTVATNVDPDSDGDPDDFTPVSFSNVALSKAIAGTPTAAASGVAGNIDVAFGFVVTNTGSATLSNLSLLDDFVAEFGGAFVRVVPGSISLTNIDSTNPPSINAGYDGSLGSDMLLGSATDVFQSGQSFRVEFIVELDPDNASANLVNGRLENQATVSAFDPFGGTVTDDSDNPADPTDTDPNVDNDPDDPTAVTFANISLEKSVSSVSPAASAIAGNYDVNYLFTVSNSGLTDLANLRLTDDWTAQFGGNFVGIVPGSAAVTNVSASVAPGVNGSYTGSGAESILDGSGLLQAGQSFQVLLTVEIDADADPSRLIGGELQNQAVIIAEDPTTPGTSVSDTSDDPTNTTNVDPDGDNDPDDPTAVRFAEISLEKTLGTVSVASSGTTGNFDVQFNFAVRNTGSDTLTNAVLTDDWLTNFGGAFVRLVPGSIVVTNVDATVAPAPNSPYTGAAAENVLDGTGVLESGQHYLVGLVVEVNPSAPTANFTNGALLNQAVVTALDSNSNIVTDTSDDPANPANDDPDVDNNPDDPTPLRFSSINLEKAATNVAPASSRIEGNYDVTYTLMVSNDGSTDLTDLRLLDDWSMQFGGNFVRILPGSVSLTNIDAAVLPGSVGSYAGGPTENMLDGTGLLNPSQSFVVELTVEVDPDADPASLVNGALNSQAIAFGSDPADLASTVEDPSDDPTDFTDVDPNLDGDPDDPTAVRIASIEITKSVAQVIPATSGAAGNFDVTYDFTVANNGSSQLNNLTVIDDWTAQFGANFVGIIPGSVVVTNIDATTPPLANATYADGTQNMLSGGGLIEASQSFMVSVVVEIDPSADPSQLTNGALLNFAVATGDDVVQPGNTATDISDDSASPSSGGPDDPTPVRIPDIEVIKRIVGAPNPASSGISGNYDVTYELVITNTGTTDLVQVMLDEDVVAQFGGAFVSISSVPTIITSTTTDAPELNSAYDGGATDANLFNNASPNTNLMRPNESLTIQFTIEIDPDNPAAITNPATGELENQANVTATDLTTSVPVTDDSDDPADPTSETDDPTPLILPQILLTMTIDQLTSLPSGNTLVDYDLVVTNSGNDTLTALELIDDWAGQFGGAFVAVGPAGVTVTNIDAGIVPGANTGYAGGPLESMLDGSGQLLPGQSFAVRVQVEVDPLSPTAIFVNGTLENSSTVIGQGTQSTVVSDASDDPFNSTDVDPDVDNDPDDPTALRFSYVGVAKSVVNLSPNGEDWNVGFQLVVRNTGVNELTQIDLFDDLATQLGPAFLAIETPPTITASSASITPGLNPLFDGGSNTNIFDGTSGELQPGEEITLQFTATLDPNAVGAPQPLNNQVLAQALDPNGDPVTDTSDAGQSPDSTNPGNPSDNGTPNDPTLIQIGDIGLAKQVVNTEQEGTNLRITLRLVIENTGTVDLNNLTLLDDVAAQYGGNFSSIESPPSIVGTTGGVIVPNLNATWSSDTSQNLFDGTSGFLPPGGQIILEFDVALQPTDNGIDVASQATVTGLDPDGNLVSDLSDDGANATGNNGLGGSDDPTPTRTSFFTFDTFNNFAHGFGQPSPVVRNYRPRPVLDTAYSGIAEPGTTLHFQIFDQSGQTIGSRTIVADAAGNWLAQFPSAATHTHDVHYGESFFGNGFDDDPSFASDSSHHVNGPHGSRMMTAKNLYGTEIDGQPHRMEVQQTSAVYNQTDSGWNVRRYFHPAVHSQLYFQQQATVSSVFATAPRNVAKVMHSLNEDSLQLSGNRHAFQLDAGSSNVASR